MKTNVFLILCVSLFSFFPSKSFAKLPQSQTESQQANAAQGWYSPNPQNPYYDPYYSQQYANPLSNPYGYNGYAVNYGRSSYGRAEFSPVVKNMMDIFKSTAGKPIVERILGTVAKVYFEPIANQALGALVQSLPKFSGFSFGQNGQQMGSPLTGYDPNCDPFEIERQRRAMEQMQQQRMFQSQPFPG
ncbi:MAG: hypothetical protein KDD48_07580 [Bdellovibrionales bacterium]|nr:hypothetical protein [Bdellovibrionales bacterium]